MMLSLLFYLVYLVNYCVCESKTKSVLLLLLLSLKYKSYDITALIWKDISRKWHKYISNTSVSKAIQCKLILCSEL